MIVRKLSFLTTRFRNDGIFFIKCFLGGGWRLIEGEKEGQTQTDLPELEEVAYFSHPLDIHLATKTIQGTLAPLSRTTYF